MRKKLFLSILVLLLLALVGCTSKNDVKVYEDTEEGNISHTEVSMTAVMLNINYKQNIVQFKDCRTGVEHNLLYHGGVRVANRHDREVGMDNLGIGSVVDVVYYEDTAKLVSVVENKATSTMSDIKKFSANKSSGKATYKGTSCKLSEHAVAINHDGSIFDVTEVSTEDKVTLHMFGAKLVSIVVDEGHGYVRLSNHDTYIGGMVEIGYDVIVPVTHNMLLTVREGTYTLRINNNGYSQSKEITVKRDTETLVDLGDIAIPTGTAVFEVTPADAVIYVEGEEISGHTYTDIYGSYSVKVEAEGYKTYRGGFKIDETVKTLKINLAEDENSTEDTEDDSTDTETENTVMSTTRSSTEENATPSDATDDEVTIVTESTDGTTGSEDETSTVPEDLSESNNGDSDAPDDSEDDTASGDGVETDNIITINTPALAGVYVDGDYVGVAPISIKKVTGTHTVTLYRSGYLIKSYTIQAEDNGKDDVYNFAELTTLLDLID